MTSILKFKLNVTLNWRIQDCSSNSEYIHSRFQRLVEIVQVNLGFLGKEIEFPIFILIINSVS